MDDNGCQVKQHARDLVGMRFEFISSSHQTIEYGTWIRESDVLQNRWLCRSCIRSIRHSKFRTSDIVVRSIGFTVLVLCTQTGLWRVRDRIPEVIDEGSSQLIRQLRIGIKPAEKTDEILKEEFVVILNPLNFGVQ